MSDKIPLSQYYRYVQPHTSHPGYLPHDTELLALGPRIARLVWLGWIVRIGADNALYCTHHAHMSRNLIRTGGLSLEGAEQAANNGEYLRLSGLGAMRTLHAEAISVHGSMYSAHVGPVPIAHPATIRAWRELDGYEEEDGTTPVPNYITYCEVYNGNVCGQVDNHAEWIKPFQAYYDKFWGAHNEGLGMYFTPIESADLPQI